MTDTTPVLDQINIVVADMAASVAFYRLLGLDVPDTAPQWQDHHRNVVGAGIHIDLDSAAFAAKWNKGARAPAKAATVLGFRLPSREAVDVLHDRMRDAGYRVQQEPFDTFFGARYAVIEDPDGNPVGLMSPIDPARRSPAPEMP